MRGSIKVPRGVGLPALQEGVHAFLVQRRHLRRTHRRVPRGRARRTRRTGGDGRAAAVAGHHGGHHAEILVPGNGTERVVRAGLERRHIQRPGGLGRDRLALEGLAIDHDPEGVGRLPMVHDRERQRLARRAPRSPTGRSRSPTTSTSTVAGAAAACSSAPSAPSFPCALTQAAPDQGHDRQHRHENAGSEHAHRPTPSFDHDLECPALPSP